MSTTSRWALERVVGGRGCRAGGRAELVGWRGPDELVVDPGFLHGGDESWDVSRPGPATFLAAHAPATGGGSPEEKLLSLIFDERTDGVERVDEALPDALVLSSGITVRDLGNGAVVVGRPSQPPETVRVGAGPILSLRAHPSRSLVAVALGDAGLAVLELDAASTRVRALGVALATDAIFTGDGARIAVLQVARQAFAVEVVPVEGGASSIEPFGIADLCPTSDRIVALCDRSRIFRLDLDSGSLGPWGDPPPIRALEALAYAGRTLWVGGCFGLAERTDRRPWRKVPLPSRAAAAADPGPDVASEGDDLTRVDDAEAFAPVRLAVNQTATSMMLAVRVETRGCVEIQRWDRAGSGADWHRARVSRKIALDDQAVAMSPDGELVVFDDGRTIVVRDRDGDYPGSPWGAGPAPRDDAADGGADLLPTLSDARASERHVALALAGRLVVGDRRTRRLHLAGPELRADRLAFLDAERIAVLEAGRGQYVDRPYVAILRIVRLDDLAVVEQLSLDVPGIVTAFAVAGDRIVVGTALGTLHVYRRGVA